MMQLPQKSVSLFQCLICWSHCDALNQRLDGPAGTHLNRDFVDLEEAESESSGLWLCLPIKAENQKYLDICDCVAFIDSVVL